MSNNEDYYTKLSLPPIPPLSTTSKNPPEGSEAEKNLRDLIQTISNQSNRETLKTALDQLITSWTHQLDQTKQQLHLQSRQLDQSLKETQHYKRLYEQTHGRRKSSLVSNKALADDVIDPVMLEACLLVESDSEDGLDILSIMSGSESSSFSPGLTPIMSPLLKSAKSNSEVFRAVRNISQDSFSVPSENVLTFGCGDGFWDTIANGKSNKAEVDALISNYLRRGGNPNVAKNSDTVKNVKEGYSLVHALIAIKNTAALQKAIDAGAKTNVYSLTSKREDKITPLVLAAKIGYINGIRLLVEKGGADMMNARGPYGENVLHAAVQSDSDEMVGYLLRLSNNKLLEIPDNNGATPLHYACITGRTRLITLFIRDCQTQSDPKDFKGETPLHYAVRNRKLKVVAKLVGELGVYPNPYIYKQVPTPLELAKAGGLKSIADYLKQAGAKTSRELEKSTRASISTDNDDQTIVHNSTVVSSSSSVLSGESSSSKDSTLNNYNSGIGVRQFIHSKTSQLLRGTFD